MSPFLLIGAGIALRQLDRAWFSFLGRRPVTVREVTAQQRRRANDLTPVLLLIGHWVEIVGWCLLVADGGPVSWMVVAAAVAVKGRHLQEVSHFAVHGVLTRSKTFGAILTEVTAHAPLGLAPVPVRWRSHVREHHPNATVTGMDPNLADLHRAGLLPGATHARFVLAVFRPLTPAGMADTVRGLADALRPGASPWWRLALFLAIPAAAGSVLGWPVLLFGVLLPRLLLYPQLAWLSLLVEHRWFDPETVTGTAREVEAGRCVRLYPRRSLRARIWETVARSTWLPYGDLHHYAHSVHPAVRWNYLPAVDRILGRPAYTPPGLLAGQDAVLTRHRRALQATA